MENGTPALRVNWTTPQSDVAISQYQVQCRRSGTTSWNSTTPLSVSPPATSTILTGLDAGTEYNVRVRAVSELGAAALWSVEQTESSFDSEFILYCLLLSGASAFVTCIQTMQQPNVGSARAKDQILKGLHAYCLA